MKNNAHQNRLGSAIPERRKQRGVSLEDAASVAELRPAFLAAIEAGQVRWPYGAGNLWALQGYLGFYPQQLKILAYADDMAAARREYEERARLIP
jgi:transcriptional regulator with XRE-family HTH domain